MSRRGLCLLLSLSQSHCRLCCSAGDAISHVFPPPPVFRPHPSSLLSSLPASLNTCRLRNSLLMKNTSHGPWLSPLGVFRYLVICECVSVSVWSSPLCFSFIILPGDNSVSGEGCMTQDCLPWEQSHSPSYFVISGRAQRHICHFQCNVLTWWGV